MATKGPMHVSPQTTGYLPTLPVFLRVEGRSPIPAEIEYISDAGMLVRSDSDVMLPATFTVRFTTTVGPCEADGTIAGRPGSPGRLAIHFSDVNETLRQLSVDLAVLPSTHRIGLLGAIIDPQVHVTNPGPKDEAG